VRVKAPHEIVRSGRRANFYIVENLLIDHYLRIVGATAFAVYCCLVRHADDHRATFVGTAKLADESNLSQRQVRRILKRLEDYGLLRIVCTRKPVRKTVYWVLPVPSPGKAASAPLFDQCSPPEQGTLVSAPRDMGVRGADMGVQRNKEEQDPLNKRGERTVEDRSSASQQPPSPIDLKNRAVTAPGSHAADLAHRVIRILSLTSSSSNQKIIEAAIVAEAAYLGCSIEEAAKGITEKAMEDRRRGIAIDRWYFEDTKWRPKSRSATPTVPMNTSHYEETKRINAAVSR
jgi:hypothetical protein